MSAPKVAWIVVDSVAFEEGDELLLVGLDALMFRLIGDVTDRVIHLRDADAEGAVAFLPGEIAACRELVVDPFRRAAFDELDGLRNRHRRWQREEQVHMIFDA